MKKSSEYPVGTKRISATDLYIYKKSRSGWNKTAKRNPAIFYIVRLYNAHNLMHNLLDAKDPRFLKGFVTPDGLIRGSRINILPDGKKLDRCFSLFSECLTIHDESSHDHWDVLYKNPSGSFSYLYTQEKKEKAAEEKFRKVKDFEKLYPKIEKNVIKNLHNFDDPHVMPIFTLLKTYMRVGSEVYYNAHGHKGLTTLLKKDIKISGNSVTFDFLAKDGVPMKITKEFPKEYISRLKNKLRGKNPNSFIFVHRESGHPLRDTHFKKAFKKYSGKEFYPHIVRSFYATHTSLDFLKKNNNPTKQEVKDFFISVAEELGHKRFDKKHNKWKTNYTVTLHHYVDPVIVRKIMSLI
jgi:hypothetical protein